MRIAVDAMGGDYAPNEIVAGALKYLASGDSEASIILVGDAERIEACLSDLNASSAPVRVIHASQNVEMNESPAVTLRKKRDSSIAVATRMAAKGEVDAIVSAGNTGALAAAALMEWELLPGVDRPAIATLIPGPFGATVLLDAGATVNCKAHNLVQFAKMGACYARHVLKKTHPVVGLLSVGEEDEKGNKETREAHALLKNSPLHFYGNVEGQDIFLGKVDVIVCDGFVGNVALKVMEGMASGIQTMVSHPQSNKYGFARLFASFFSQSPAQQIRRHFDVRKFGGAPLLGVNGTCIIAHGNSHADALCAAIFRAQEIVAHDLNRYIAEALIQPQEIERS